MLSRSYHALAWNRFPDGAGGYPGAKAEWPRRVEHGHPRPGLKWRHVWRSEQWAVANAWFACVVQEKLGRTGVAAAPDQHYQDHRAGRGGGVHREGVEISNHRRLAANLLRQPGKPGERLG